MNRVNANSNIHADVTSASKLYREEDGEKIGGAARNVGSLLWCILNECKQSVPGMDGPVDHHHVLWMAWVRSEREEDGAQFLSEWGVVGKKRNLRRQCLVGGIYREQKQQKICRTSIFCRLIWLYSEVTVSGFRVKISLLQLATMTRCEFVTRTGSYPDGALIHLNRYLGCPLLVIPGNDPQCKTPLYLNCRQ